MAAQRNNNFWPYKSIRGKKGNEGQDALVVSSVEVKEHSLFLSERETRLVIKRLEPLLRFQAFPSVSKHFQTSATTNKASFQACTQSLRFTFRSDSVAFSVAFFVLPF